MLKMKCCGQERTTKFCPECGKKLEHPLSALHRHLDGVVKIDVAKLQSVKKDTKFKNGNAVLFQRRVARVEKTLAKWLTWRDAVRDVIIEVGGPCVAETDPPEPKEPELDKGSHKKPEQKPEKAK